jgi:amino acid adenylation domain-containing protein
MRQTDLPGTPGDTRLPKNVVASLVARDRPIRLTDWNATQAPYPRDSCIHFLFQEQVVRSPGAVAVTCGSRSLTYAELDRAANGLAHRLRELGVGPEVLVALAMDRSLDMIVSMLATLKAGGAYVPLDPAYPATRLAYMLQDTRAPVLLTQRHLAGRLPAGEARLIAVDAEEADLARRPAHAVEALTTAGNLAYVMYTSGSTGRPKGVCATHRNVIRLVKGTDFAELTDREVMLQLTSISFDPSAFEIWGSLLNGGRLVVFPGMTPSLVELAEFIEREGITTTWLTAGLFAQIAARHLPALRHVRQLLSGGDVLPVPIVRRVVRELPGCRLIDGYGPTENTIFTTCHTVTPEDRLDPSVPIGRPIANTQAYVLDAAMRPVPDGVIGELYAGGDGVTRGYLHHPDLTAERFVPHPFSDTPGERLYRTGDLVRRGTDGTIEFIGRADTQVKVSGYRVELGEIEAALAAHPAVSQAVVVASGAGAEEKRLIGYVASGSSGAPRPRELREHLRTRLPAHMIPSRFVVLESLPLTSNGKVDRRALPAPERVRPDLETAWIAPRDSVEADLASVWTEILGMEAPGVDDGFFDLGGHSLAATQIVARIRDRFGVELPLLAFFESPTIAGLAGRLREASPGTTPGPAAIAGTEVVAGADVVAQAPPGPVIAPAGRSGDLPLSMAQERIHFLQQLDPADRSYQFQATLRLRGDLDITALERSLTEIVRRHEILRTTFPIADGRPLQRIHDPFPVRLAPVDVGPAVSRAFEDEMARPFDLARLPLARWTLFRLGPREHVLLHVEHHLVHDGWSFNVFLSELTALYRAYAAGGPSPLPEPPIQFVDFALWQRRWLKEGVADAQIAYWKRRLAGSPGLLDLPRDRPRPAVQRHRGAAPRVELPGALCDALRSFGRREGATLFMTLLAALQTLLHRCTGQDDICVGSGIANRRWRETEGLIGMVINTLALRTDLSGDPTFRELLTRTRATTLEAYAHQDVPFDMVVDAVRPARDLSHNPIFQVMLGFHDAPLAPLDLPGLDVELTEALSNGTAKFDLNVTVIPRAEQRLGRGHGDERAPGAETEGITLIWEYDTDLFEPATIERLIGHYQTLLEDIVERPGRRLSELAVLRDDERRTLAAWGRTEAVATATLPELFEAQTARTPDAVAVEHGDALVSYRELNRRADRLARELSRRGVGPEDRVAICVDRSIELLVGLLAILKAGGAYVPLDSGHPRERLAFLLRDAAPRLLLSRTGLADRLPPGDAPVLFVDEAQGMRDEAPVDRPAAPVATRASYATPDPEGLAYVIYTSGSTGRPKGVAITHGALAGALLALRAGPGIDPSDRLLAVTTITFDIAALELFLPLVAGARVVLADRECAADAPRLIDALARSRATLMQATPATWQMLIEAGWRASPPFRVFCGGERMPDDLAARLTEGGAAAWNLYGPTEATIWCTAHPVDPALGGARIGRPIRGSEAHVLDGRMNPSPIGVPGELYVGGAGLARGYHGRPDLTAGQFVPHPFAHRPGERLYRTGDRARWLADGALEFLGRSHDGQVKVRGHRIELGEIEAALRSHPAVQDAAVARREDRPGDARLVAYVVARAGAAGPGGAAGDVGGAAGDDRLVPALRAHLAERLPDYMTPAAYVQLEALPRTVHGKVDRKALPAPDWQPPREAGEGPAPPGSPVEEALAAIWAGALGAGRVGIDDDFFEAGGHSLLATQVMARARQTFGVDLPLRLLFETRTVRRLAEEIARARADGRPAAESLPPIVPDPKGRHDPFPLTDVQQAYWAGRGDAFALGNVATHVYLEVECAGLSLERLESGWRRLVERHDMLRAVVRPDGEQQVLAEVPPYRIETLDLRGVEPSEAAQRAAAVRAAMSHRVLPSDRWPLFEIRATRLDAGRVLLHIGIDALILDAWSVRLLFAELRRLYEDPGASLPPLEITFRDYVLADRRRRGGESHRRALAYWRDRLADLPPAPGLPLVTPAGAMTPPRFTRRTRRLDPDAWRRLRERGAREGLTPSVLLLAAYAETLGTWSRGPRFTLNLTLFNRLPLHPHVSRIAGDFTSLTLLEVEHATRGPFAERARSLQRRLWQDLDHGEVGGVQVLRELARQRGARGSVAAPLMPVVFTSTLNLSALGQGGSPWSWLGRLVHSVTQTPQVWLDHQAAEQDGAVVLNWDAVDALFPAGLIPDMLEAYGGLLQRLADEPAAWNEARRSLVPAEQAARCAAINATEGPVSEALLHDLFAARAAESPGRTAIVSARRALTYGETARAAGRVARRLQRLGARPDTLVAVVLDKGWEPIVASLGVLASGAAYLPIEPDVPAERFANLLRHGEVALALTSARLDAALRWPDGVRRLLVEEIADAPDPADGDVFPSPQGVRPDHLAYVIHTSGSTGIPKGVMIEHRAAVNTLLDVNERFGVGPADRILALSSTSFDLSVFDMFGALAAGATIVVPGPGTARDPASCAATLSAEGVTIWNSVPALMRLLVEYLEGRGERLPAALRLVLLSGDWIPVGLPDRIRALAPQARIVSLGGATEAAIWSILHPIDAVEAGRSSIPYGRPMRNQRVHVYGDDLEPRPPGATGQLYIAGTGLARGYWRDEERTAAGFIVHPRTGERLYRTGDLARHLADGTVELLGRDDFQIKIQGYRIELGEIESVLARHPAVRQAVAAAVGERDGERRLVAWVEMPDRGTSVLDLRRYLEERLPAYMVPSAIVRLDALPLGPNAKVDRAALPPPAPDAPAAAPAAPSVSPAAESAPAAPLRIATRVAGILGREQVEPEANWLDLGASSVDMVRIANVVELETGFRPRIDHLYAEPTVDALIRAWMDHAARDVAAGPATDSGPMPEPRPETRVPAILRDPEERALFKTRRAGLRHDLSPRRRSVALPEAEAGPIRLAERRTHRHFAAQPVPLARLGGLLADLRQRRGAGEPRFAYPSAGGLYPVQTYLHVKPGRVSGLPPGFYYHQPVEHRLVLLSPDGTLDRSLHEPLVNAPVFDEAAFSIFLVGRLAAIEPMYGALLARDFCLIEAGAILQLLMLAAPAHAIGLCPIGRMEFEPVASALGLEETDFLAHSLLGGREKPKP